MNLLTLVVAYQYSLSFCEYTHPDRKSIPQAHSCRRFLEEVNTSSTTKLFFLPAFQNLALAHWHHLYLPAVTRSRFRPCRQKFNTSTACHFNSKPRRDGLDCALIAYGEQEHAVSSEPGAICVSISEHSQVVCKRITPLETYFTESFYPVPLKKKELFFFPQCLLSCL